MAAPIANPQAPQPTQVPVEDVHMANMFAGVFIAVPLVCYGVVNGIVTLFVVHVAKNSPIENPDTLRQMQQKQIKHRRSLQDVEAKLKHAESQLQSFTKETTIFYNTFQTIVLPNLSESEKREKYLQSQEGSDSEKAWKVFLQTFFTGLKSQHPKALKNSAMEKALDQIKQNQSTFKLSKSEQILVAEHLAKIILQICLQDEIELYDAFLLNADASAIGRDKSFLKISSDDEDKDDLLPNPLQESETKEQDSELPDNLALTSSSSGLTKDEILKDEYRLLIEGVEKQAKFYINRLVEEESVVSQEVQRLREEHASIKEITENGQKIVDVAQKHFDNKRDAVNFAKIALYGGMLIVPFSSTIPMSIQKARLKQAASAA